MTETAPGSVDAARGGRRIATVLAAATLNLVVTKPIAIFVWWLSRRANRMCFHRRAELGLVVASARRCGRPVLFASSHVSMFDDPIVPMALFRTGPRAAAELTVLVLLLALWWAAPTASLPRAPIAAAALLWAAGIAHLGAHKTWWSLGDLVNFSGSSALRAKLEGGRERSPSRIQRWLLAAADPVIFSFMRSSAVKTVFVDRRAGEEAKATRARAVAQTVECAARCEPVWIFFEGGRAKAVGEIGPARRGIGEVIVRLRARGLEPLVVAVHHRGLEKLMPRGSRRWLSTGHRIEVSWCECACDPSSGARHRADEAQSIADGVRAAVVQLQNGRDRESRAVA